MKHKPLQPTTYNLQPAQKGQAMLMATIFFLAVSVSLMLGTAVPVVRQNQISEDFLSSRQSYLASESGLEDALNRLKKGKQISPTETLMVGSSTATTTIADVGSNEKEVSAIGNFLNRIRKSRAEVTVASGASFNYGVQSGNGGFLMENNSSVIGNIYSNGPVEGQNSNIVYGDVVSAGPSGTITGIHATSSAYAHTISNSTIDKDAHYQVISNTTVDGTSYPGSPDQLTASMPISDELISQWESEAASGGTVSSPCPYEINDDVTIGPVKINCDLEINGNPNIILTGPIWVVGKINIKNSPVTRIASSLGNKSVAIIADNSSDRLTSSNISLENSAGFYGSGGAGSYVLMVSQNNSAENSGVNTAIDLKNGAQGDLLLYAAHGEVLMQNSSSLKEVTAYRVHLKNFAQVSYVSGLANLLFTGGPSGAWTIKSWKESE